MQRVIPSPRSRGEAGVTRMNLNDGMKTKRRRSSFHVGLGRRISNEWRGTKNKQRQPTEMFQDAVADALVEVKSRKNFVDKKSEHNYEQILMYSYIMNLVMYVVVIESAWLNDQSPTMLTNLAKLIGLVCTIVLVGSAYKLETMAHRRLSDGLIIQLLLLAVHQPPFVYIQYSASTFANLEVQYNLDSVLAFIAVIARTLYMAPVVVQYFGVNVFKLNRILSSWNYVNLRDPKVILRAVIHRRPFASLALLFLCGILTFAYLIMIPERGLCSLRADADQSFEFYDVCESKKRLSNFINCVWLICCTVTTVGYGDVSPNTLIGQIFSFCAAIYGLTITAVAIHCVIEMLTQTDYEQQTLQVLEGIDLDREHRNAAAKLIQAVWRFHRKRQSSLANESVRRRKDSMRDIYTQGSKWKFLHVPRCLDSALRRRERDLARTRAMWQRSVESVQQRTWQMKFTTRSEQYLRTKLEQSTYEQREFARIMAQRQGILEAKVADMSDNINKLVTGLLQQRAPGVRSQGPPVSLLSIPNKSMHSVSSAELEAKLLMT